MKKRSAIVVGAGIVGLATARTLAMNNYSVRVIERNAKAVGASIRNFGMIWPIGQPDGDLYETAMRSRRIWKEVSMEAGIWHDEVGSLHLAYDEKEWCVLQELMEIYSYREYRLFDPAQTIITSPAVRHERLKGSLFGPDEMIVDPRQAIAALPTWLSEKWDVEFTWGKAVTDISYPAVYMGGEEFEADEIYVCSGADFETLYPEVYASAPLTKCKLQMMRLSAQPDQWRMGPALCGGLSLVHYKSFMKAASITELADHYKKRYPEYLQMGIHVMVSQNEQGELIVGDSHEYGATHEPFNKQWINRLILDYLRQFAHFMDETVTQTWNGIYPKLTNGEANLVVEPEPGVLIL
ncbi:MAG TPA: TIGR03364 family FAD-dependent oxidoreductase, partial [Chitinophagaceae bacterium]|nr:TIGR03364 family FAD-dependent oxidoreductase [Chitinophagaceae bacterium]